MYLLERSLQEEFDSVIIIMIQMTLTIVVIRTERVNNEFCDNDCQKYFQEIIPHCTRH